MVQVACNDFNKKCIDTGRVYQPGFAVYITLALKKYAKFCQIQRQQDTR